MALTTWRSGTALNSPVYLDACVLVGATVSKHRLYKQTVEVIGEVLASGATILVSLLAVQESLWALASLSYYDLFGHRGNPAFTKKTYLKHCDKIFAKYGDRMGAVHSMVGAWTEAGVPVAWVAKTDSDSLRVSDLTPRYMREWRLTPADAAHLALAKTYARTFITADSHFKVVAQSGLIDELVVVHLTGA
jgi:predicted nucleic acid-binding protein